MRRQRLNRWLSGCAVGVLVSACADHPPAVIEDRSVMQVEVVPEVRQSVPFEQDEAEAAESFFNSRPRLCGSKRGYALLGGLQAGNGLPNAGAVQRHRASLYDFSG